MTQRSPTIPDILHWISKHPNPKLIDKALQHVVQKLLLDESPPYHERALLFQELKKLFPAGGSSLIPQSVYSPLPFPVAHTLQQVNEHSYSNLVQLLFLFDAVEIAVRWLVGVYTGIVLHENNGALPSRLADTINGPVKRATFGAWVSILRELSKSIKNPQNSYKSPKYTT